VLHDLAEGGLVPRLGPAYQRTFLAVLIVHSRLDRYTTAERGEWEGASQCSHTPLRTHPTFMRLHLLLAALPL
jgi:hypothetical protein